MVAKIKKSLLNDLFFPSMAIDKLISYKIESVNERGEKDVSGAYWRFYKWLEEKEGVLWADGMVYGVGKSYHTGASKSKV
jgi:hypothetical protein